MLIGQLKSGKAKAELQYRRAVRPEGNPTARQLLTQVFEPVDALWRGLGAIPASGLNFNIHYRDYDARRRFQIEVGNETEIPGCSCGAVLSGKLEPDQCPLFGNACTPIQPVGPCMVSQEELVLPLIVINCSGGKGMKHSHILLAHGSGGRLSQQLIEEMFVSSFDKHAVPRELNDGAVLALPPGKVVMSTDSFVISPLFFPGGDIGKLAVSGTVNDLVACGSRPLYLSTAFILEEGFSLDSLRRIVQSMADTARLAGVELVTGDTKVVEKGSVDQIFINTAGIGVVPDGVVYQPGRINAGDRVLVTGTIGDHGLTILAEREGFKFNTPVTSDCAPLHEIGQSLQPLEKKFTVCVTRPEGSGNGLK